VSAHGAFWTSAHKRGDDVAVGPQQYSDRRVVIDEVSLALILFAVILNIQAGTYYHEFPELVNVIDIVQMLLMGSAVVMLMLAITGQIDLKYDWFLSRSDIGLTLFASIAGFALALMLWNFIIAPATASVFEMVKELSVYNQRIFYAKVAVAEEMLMMGMLFPYLAARLKWAAYPSTMVAFAILHFAVYGTKPSALWAVAMYRGVFLAQWRLTGCRLSVPMLTHLFINLSA